MTNIDTLLNEATRDFLNSFLDKVGDNKEYRNGLSFVTALREQTYEFIERWPVKLAAEVYSKVDSLTVKTYIIRQNIVTVQLTATNMLRELNTTFASDPDEILKGKMHVIQLFKLYLNNAKPKYQ